ncbi:MAG: C1 family peptidase [Bacteroidales bacterium]|jgi:C1A family cysteine protease|nr:C1 family peptidase [Bacteroidales bacterium]
MKKFERIMFAMIIMTLVLAFGCTKEENENPDPEPTEYSLGWFGEDDPDSVPSSTNFGFGSGDVPPSYSLVDKFPPIGDQGQYGTCVAWAVAYNTKTMVNGLAKGYGPSDLASANKQFSPRDLFTAIDDANKGENCGGTNFNFALDLVQTRGVATLATAPYTTNLGTCSKSTLDPAWTQEAAGFKFKWWRKIDGSIAAIKENISQNVPVVFGARLADNFMSHNSDEVISSATSYDNVGQHAYHAMVIAGYDDNKGPNGAFRCINSWGTSWGGDGYFWVDYNFFMNEFLSSLSNEINLYIAANDDSNTEPPDDIDPNVTGVDLIPWVFFDYSTLSWDWPTERKIDFNIYNAGNADASSSSDWAYYYIYYNAFDADDYGIIFYDQFNTSVPENTYDCPNEWNCIFNIPIPAGDDFANYAWGELYVERTYYMPEITGFYYLLCLADAEDKFQEQDEVNNLFYTTIDPVYFEYGIEYKSSERKENPFDFKNDIAFSKENIKRSKYNSGVTERFRNAYTPEEIKAFFKKEKESGRMDLKVDEYVQRNASLEAKKDLK